MRWTVHGERALYESEWMTLTLVDVELPSGKRFEHHVLRIPDEAAAAVVFDPNRGVLMLWRHRFVTDSSGWELPAGRLDAGETPEQAAARETLEETGWRPSALRRLGSYFPLTGAVSQRFHVFVADGAEHERDPDPDEAERVEWLPVPRLRELIRTEGIGDGLTLTGLLWALELDAIR